jgi:tetratricopeptide (TPR) repeat protein
MSPPDDLPPPPAEDAPPAPAAPLPELPRRRRRLPRFRALLGGLVAVGVGMGTSLALGFGRAKPEPVEHESARVLPDEEDTPPDAERIDLMIRSGWYADALKRCRVAPLDLFGPDERPLVYREAACLEGLSKWKEAREAYRKAADGEADPATQLWATLGQARCAAAGGDLGTARGLLDRVVLRSGSPESHDPRLLGSCLYLRARLGLLEAEHRSFPDPLDERSLAWPTFDAGLEYATGWLPSGEASPEPHHAAHAAPRTMTVERHPWVPGVYEITAHVPATPTAQLVKEIGAAAGLPVHMDADAASRLGAAPAVAVDVEHAPLPEVLTALTGPHGVECRLAAGVLEIHAGHADPHARLQPLWEAVWRAAWCVPDHPTARAARLTLANLDFEAGRGHQAAAGYLRFLEASPHAPEAICAEYNLGLMDLRDGGRATARARLRNVIDRAPRTRWEDIGWWWTGRSFLDEGDTASARKPFESARNSRSEAIASAAVLGLAACDLLDGKAEEAGERLRKQRPHSREAYTATAAGLEAVVRFRLAPSELRAEAACDALRTAGDGLALGPAGVHLAGRVYVEAGRPDLMVGVYDTAAETLRGPLAVRMAFDAAEHFYRSDSRRSARARFLAVTVADPTGLGPLAQLRLADLAARDGRGAECVGRCRAALGKPGVEQDDVLRVMGRGFELERQYRLAAECFAGRVPAE